MTSTEIENYFGVADFIIFIGLLLVSSAIGTYFAYKDRRNKSTETYYFGNRKLSPFPVAMSMAVSYVSAITVIGYPVEVYLYGTVLIWFVIAAIASAIISAIYYIPLIFRLELYTIYEYLELRFNSFLRKLVSGTVVCNTIIYMGITVYLPALALNAVTPMHLNWSIVLTSVICTFYTTIGGMKAVIWTDVIQGFIMIFGALAVFIKTVIMIGGLGNLAAAVERGGRNNFIYFDTDPRIRSTSITLFFGAFINSLVGSCCSQVYSQRYLSCKSAHDAKKATIMRLLPMGLFMLLATADGLAMYAYYENCDPTSAGIITKEDQTTPRMALEIFQDMPGMAGLFVSAAYSGTLSTVSSGINALAAMALEDFVKPHWPQLTSSRKALISRILSILVGLLVMAMAFITSLLESTVIQISVTIAGIVGGPILSVYTMGVFVPWTNTIGAITGTIIGWLISGWVSMAAIIYKPSPEFREKLPVTTTGCNFTLSHTEANLTYYENSGLTTVFEESATARPLLADTIYSLSPFMYGVLGFVAGCIVTLIVSVLTGVNKAGEANPALFVPILDNKKIFPKCMIKFFRFGVPEYDETVHKIKKKFDIEKDTVDKEEKIALDGNSDTGVNI